MARNPRADQIGTGGRIKSEPAGGWPRNAQTLRHHSFESIHIAIPIITRFSVNHTDPSGTFAIAADACAFQLTPIDVGCFAELCGPGRIF